MKVFVIIIALFFLCFQTPDPILDHSQIKREYITPCDSLQQELFLAKYKIERVKYYLKICQKNPSQTKFLRSWVTRAVQ
jgi:hypothetical protein